MTYQLLRNGIRRLADGAAIPTDIFNRDYIKYMEWLDAGGIPEPEDSTWIQDRAVVLSEFRTKREAYLNRIIAIAFVAKDDGQTAIVNAAKTMRQGLLDMQTYPTVAAANAAEDIEALKQAIQSRFTELVDSLPVAARDAFKKVDQ